MKISKTVCVLALLTLSEIVQGSLVSLAQPILLTLGAAFTALDLELTPDIEVNWRGWLMAKKQDEFSGKKDKGIPITDVSEDGPSDDFIDKELKEIYDEYETKGTYKGKKVPTKR